MVRRMIFPRDSFYMILSPHLHRCAGFLGHTRSSGFIPQSGTSDRAEITALMTDLFARHQQSGKVEFHYIMRFYCGHMDG